MLASNLVSARVCYVFRGSSVKLDNPKLEGTLQHLPQTIWDAFLCKAYCPTNQLLQK